MKNLKFNLLLLLLLLSFHVVCGQRYFTTNVAEQSRSYILYETGGSQQNTPFNLPLVLLLSDRAISSELFQQVEDRALVVVATQGEWKCDNSLQRESLFVQRMISDVYENFRIDRNRVFSIHVGESSCVGEILKQLSSNPIQQSYYFSSSVSSSSLSEVIATAIKNKDSVHSRFELWSTPKVKSPIEEQQQVDSAKYVTWAGRIMIEFRTGGFWMLRSVSTTKDKSYMDLSRSRQLLDLQLTTWMNDSMAWFIDVGWLKVPRKMELNGSKIEAGGGGVIPVTVGLKYALRRHWAHPYFLLGTGFIPVTVAGGRFSTSATPQSIQSNTRPEQRLALHTTLGTGVDCRVGRYVLLGGNLRYLHSSHFKSIGAVNAVRGFNASLCMGIILGADRIKKN